MSPPRRSVRQLGHRSRMSSDQRSPLRAQRRLSARRTDAAGTARVPARADTVREIERELEAWRARAVPDRSMPLEADDVARLVGDCLVALGLDEEVAWGFPVNTVLFFRRRDILLSPMGTTMGPRGH